MARVKRGITTHARHKKIIKMASGYRGRSKNCFRIAVQKVEKALLYAYRDRRCRKRNFKKLWIQRINAATRQFDLSYSQFINGINRSGIKIDRKNLSNLAIQSPEVFSVLVDKAKAALVK